MNRSTFYKCIHHAPSNREIENKKLDADILAIYYDTNCRYGAPKKKVFSSKLFSKSVSQMFDYSRTSPS